MMQAVEIRHYGGPEQLTLVSRPIPQPTLGQVLVKVHAFGLNRAEVYMRSGAWGHVAKTPGIECVGEVVRDDSGRLARGQRVFALMGGMGRTIQGSYAEFVCVPESNVVPIDSTLGWTELAAIPESYATAYSIVVRTLQLESGQLLLVRGGTSALGQAAINVARELGARVFASTRSAKSFPFLESLGATPVLEQAALSRTLAERVDCTLDLIGTSTLLDSMALTVRGGRVCLAGFLGGHEPLAPLNPIMYLPSHVHWSVFASLRLGTVEFPLSDIPFQTIVRRVEQGRYRAAPARVFGLDQVADAHRLMESNNAGGKLVVAMGGASA